MEVLGPPDIEERVGLTGGHIFQGEILPQYMWDRRLRARTPMPGVLLCGAGTHPGGSVIAPTVTAFPATFTCAAGDDARCSVTVSGGNV